MPESDTTAQTGSLLDEETTPSVPEPKRPGWLVRADGKLRAGIAACWRRTPIRYSILGVLVGAGATVATMAWLESRVQPPPDYETASIDVLFDYTLLTDDFNNLPIEERLELIKQLIARLQDVGGGDSVLIAYFASLIAGEARAQLGENTSRLVIDLMDSYAVEYDTLAELETRDAFMIDKAIEFQKTMEGLAGVNRDISDEERVADMREQAGRDRERMQSGEIRAGDALRMFDVVNNVMGQHASGHQKIRIAKFMQDMVLSLGREVDAQP